MYRISAQPMIPAKEIQARIQVLAKQISEEYEFDVILSSLTGAFMFTADLCRALANPSHQVVFIKASSYGSAMKSCGKPIISGLEKLDLKDKRILLIDDILDTGKTMVALVKSLKEMGVKDLRTCVLLNKEERRTENFHANFVGFEIANEFVVGYGLDFDEEYRTLSDIWTLEEINF